MGAQPACSCSSVQTQGGEENRLALLSSTLPHSRWARRSPVPLRGLVRPLAPPDPRPAFRFPGLEPGQLCCSRRRSPEGGWLVFWSWQQGGCCEGRCGPPGSQDLSTALIDARFL